jgi:dTDP-4-dehydrorhamnose reductase
LRILVIGADGTIGSASCHRLAERGHTVIGTTRRRSGASWPNSVFLDLLEPDFNVDNLPVADTAVICAAVTQFVLCRDHPEQARRVNVTAPVELARGFIARDMHVVRLSSTGVFNTKKPMVPANLLPNSRSLYGRLQAEAERLILASSRRTSVVRFTKIVRPDFALMTKWVSELIEGKTIEAFEDHGICPISLDCAVEALTGVIESRQPGIYQVSASRDLSYLDLAQYLVNAVGLPPDRVVSIHAHEKGIPLEEIVPNSSLDSTTLTALTGFMQPDPYRILDEVFGPMFEQARARMASITRL